MEACIVKATGANGSANGGIADHFGEESDDDADNHVPKATAAAGEDCTTTKTKKKRKPKKKKRVANVQTEPPSVLISQLFPKK